MIVERTQEFERVRALPRRAITLEQARAHADRWTRALALRPGVALRPWQGAALAEAHTCGGAWLALPVGTGKTLISALLPTVLRAERTLLLVPASLRAKTYADFAAYRGAWRMPEMPIRVESREMLATMQGATLIDAFAPDLIVIDEADDLSNARSAAARRIDRYVRDHAPRVVAMTGTPARKSILDYWHLLAWTLGDGAPIPLIHEEAFAWSRALDDYRGQHFAPGPLGRTIRAARAWYRERVVATAGVLVVDEDSAGDVPLTVRVRVAGESTELDAAFRLFAVEQENPGGIPVSDPLSRWLLDAQLGLGLYTRWNPPPPDEWRAARRAVARFVRERIDASTRSKRPLDTEAQVLRAYPDAEPVRAWLAAKPLFDARTETVWFSRATLDSAHAWLHESDASGIVWCGSVDFGRAFAREAGLAYYGRQGRTDEGRELHAADSARSMVCSWGANKKGHNLQAWRRALVVMPPQSAKWLEQIFGRSHRAGQTEPVTVDVLATSGGTLDAFDAALREASMVRDTIALTQKVLRARVEREEPRVTASNEMRWARREK